MFVEFSGYKFKKIVDINPKKERSGEIKEFFPQNNYKNDRGHKLHKYGNGPFCEFKVPDIHEQGVYLLRIDEKPVYVGECEDFSQRWNTGYAKISPRACFEGGQSTNCRINSIIFSAIKSEKKVELFFKKLTDRFALEHELISKINPMHNKTIGKPSLSSAKILTKKKPSKKITKIKSTSDVKYAKSKRFVKLTNFLKESNQNVTLDFSQLEKILGFKLPPSAYKYKAWWSNSGHTHSNTWIDAGYKVVRPKPGIEIRFEKSI